MTDGLIRGEVTVIRPLVSTDVDLMIAWFSDPEVYRWWDGYPKSREEVEKEFAGGRDSDMEPFIIEANGEPIGYIQYWIETDSSGGIDMFLVPSAREQGLGPDAARAMVRYLTGELRWRRVTVDPAMGNARAIRAWSKAGFIAEREMPDHPDGPALLMAIEATGEVEPG
ncbi:MAG: GNAT family N-acetyltransferase [Dehalococcoidia bacterium]